MTAKNIRARTSAPDLKEILIEADRKTIISIHAVIRVRRVGRTIPRRIGTDGAAGVMSANSATVPIRLNVGIVLRSAGDQCVSG